MLLSFVDYSCATRNKQSLVKQIKHLCCLNICCLICVCVYIVLMSWDFFRTEALILNLLCICRLKKKNNNNTNK